MTSPQSILSVLWAQGFTVELGEGGRLLVSPASTLHDSQREVLQANKQEIVRYLEQCQAQARQLQEELIRAAMRACDCWGDSPERREEMRQDCCHYRPSRRGPVETSTASLAEGPSKTNEVSLAEGP